MEHAKEKMMDTFLELAENAPISKIKVKHLTDASGYNRCTFYQYFNDIYDLLEQLEDSLITKISNEVQKAYDDSTSYSELLEIATASLQEFSRPLCILMGPNGSPSFQFKYKNALRPILASAISRHNNEFNDIILEYALGAFISTTRYWYKHPETMSSKELAKTIYKLMMNGIL